MQIEHVCVCVCAECFCNQVMIGKPSESQCLTSLHHLRLHMRSALCVQVQVSFHAAAAMAQPAACMPADERLCCWKALAMLARAQSCGGFRRAQVGDVPIDASECFGQHNSSAAATCSNDSNGSNGSNGASQLGAAAGSTGDLASEDHLGAALALYDNERYVLVPSHELSLPTDLNGSTTVSPEFVVGIKAGAQDHDRLQATLQAAWHVEHRASFAPGRGGECECMLQALEHARQQLPDFVEKAEQAGWDPTNVIMWSSQRNILSL
jgi:hypothetical protein